MLIQSSENSGDLRKHTAKASTKYTLGSMRGAFPKHTRSIPTVVRLHVLLLQLSLLTHRSHG